MEKQGILDFLQELQAFDKELLANAVIEGGKQSVQGGRIKMYIIYENLAIQKKLTPKEVESRITIAVQTLHHYGNLPLIRETFGTSEGRIFVTPLKFVRRMIKKFA